jgi:2,3-bisphosphoglycerate-independent phosphoglycerate mutase
MKFCAKNNVPPILMVVLDGFGIAPNSPYNAIKNAYTPNLDSLFSNFPHCQLKAAGTAVGLIDGIVGNSEVGHMNLGAGRVVDEDLVIINKAIQDKSFFKNKVLVQAMRHVKKNNSRLHLMGLLSDAGVHSYLPHLFALLDLAKQKGVTEVFIHGFTDGRDVPQTSAVGFVDLVQKYIQEKGVGKIATLAGRFYAMDRIDQWSRSAKVYHTMISGQPKFQGSADDYLRESYDKGVTDEFLRPVSLVGEDHEGVIHDNDAIVFWHLRSDRARQLTKAFVQRDFTQFFRGNMLRNLNFVALTDFGSDLSDVETAFAKPQLVNSLPEVLAAQSSLQQLYIAEAEKFPHVSYFFHGGKIDRLPNEDLIKLDSPHVQNYASRPAMASDKVTEMVLEDISETYNQRHDFTLMNLSNADMIAHTGNYEKTIIAVEYLDKYIGELYRKIREVGGTMIITADHGNAEIMFDPIERSIDPSHSENPVPFLLIPDKNINVTTMKLKDGVLGNVAPTILELFKIPKPKEMTEGSLFS